MALNIRRNGIGYAILALCSHASGSIIIQNQEKGNPMSSVNPQSYTIDTFSLPDAGRIINTLAINDLGRIVGIDTAYAPSGKGAGEYAFKDDHGTFTNLPSGIYPIGINDWGALVGSQGNGHGGEQGFVLFNGVVTAITDPNNSNTTTAGAGGGSTSANGINNLGQVVGSYNVGPTTFGFLENRGAFKTIAAPDSSYTTAEAVNDLGKIIGTYQDSGIKEHGFLYTNGAFKTIDAPGALFTQPLAINDFGKVVGYYTQDVNGLAAYHGFIYDHNKLATFDVPGATDTKLTGLNNLGQIAGFYTDATGQHAFVADPKFFAV